MDEDSTLKDKAPDKGANNEIVLHVMRHGDRDLEGNLEEYGRQNIKAHAAKSYLSKQTFDGVKAFGSTAGPKTVVPDEDINMQRSLETAHIFGKAVAGSATRYTSRPRNILSYDNLILERPLDHTKTHEHFVNEFINQKLQYKDTSFDELSDKEKRDASAYADHKTVSLQMSMEDKKSYESRKEIASTFAALIHHYKKMAQEKIDSNQKLLFILGSHTGMIEPFLLEEGVLLDAKGQTMYKRKLDDIGGYFKPSEGFDIILSTDQSGKLKQVKLHFDNASRGQSDVYLNMNKIEELAQHYSSLHHKRYV